jgi:hypothetical protein
VFQDRMQAISIQAESRMLLQAGLVVVRES